jgi:hypothetical protein
LNGFFFKDITFCCFCNSFSEPEELSTFKASVENNLGYNIENTPNYQNTAINAAMGLHDDGKTGGTYLLSIKIISLTTWRLNGFFFKDITFCCFCNSFSAIFDATQQKGSGPIFEIKQTTHKNPVNKKALHPYGKKKNPNNPVNRKEWDKDRPAINKERLKRLEKQRI